MYATQETTVSRNPALLLLLLLLLLMSNAQVLAQVLHEEWYKWSTDALPEMSGLSLA